MCLGALVINAVDAVRVIVGNDERSSRSDTHRVRTDTRRTDKYLDLYTITPTRSQKRRKHSK